MTSFNDTPDLDSGTSRRPDGRPRRSPPGNTRLTALTGTVLLLLLAVQGFTLLSIRQLITVHVFVGLLLIGPVCLKIATTVYRFARYYSGDRTYRQEPRPHDVLRIIGPAVVVTSTWLLASGVALAAFGRHWDGLPMLLVHQVAFWCWVSVMTLHVLARVWRLPRLVRPELGMTAGREARVAGGALRWTALAVALAAGLAIAFAGVHLASGWEWHRGH